MPLTTSIRAHETQTRTGSFILLLLLVNIVMDGLPKVGSTLQMQLVLLPITFLFVLAFWYLFSGDAVGSMVNVVQHLAIHNRVRRVAVLLEVCFVGLFLYETRHFSAFGYRMRLLPNSFALLVVIVGLCATLWRRQLRPAFQLAMYLAIYATGQTLSVLAFPLNYLRSDMLPVILWADRALLARQNPYQHFYVADRIYDFPYLPGMMLAFLPAQALHVDLRWAAIAYVVLAMCFIYTTTKPQFRLQACGLIALFVLSPYLQYRHELYTQAHFLSLVLIFVLMHKRWYSGAAAAFGVSMVISQFSWVIFPFFLLNVLRRNSWTQVLRMALVAAAVSFLLMAPFLSSGAGNIAHNAVGQWDRLDRPIARPMNLSFWASYLVRPSHLKWVQLVLLSAIFCYCWAKGRCADLADTLRWMILALLTFILFNVLVDGYFYLMLLVPMLVYTCVANGWWGPEGSAPIRQIPGESLAQAATL